LPPIVITVFIAGRKHQESIMQNYVLGC